MNQKIITVKLEKLEYRWNLKRKLFKWEILKSWESQVLTPESEPRREVSDYRQSSTSSESKVWPPCQKQKWRWWKSWVQATSLSVRSLVASSSQQHIRCLVKAQIPAHCKLVDMLLSTFLHLMLLPVKWPIVPELNVILNIDVTILLTIAACWKDKQHTQSIK